MHWSLGRTFVMAVCSQRSLALGVPNKKFRLALVRPFLAGKLDVGVNMMIASGYPLHPATRTVVQMTA
jgi:hypothetical protein